VLADINSDGGGTGSPWTDSTGYAVQFGIGSASAPTIQVGKRTDQANTSLLEAALPIPGQQRRHCKRLCLDTVYTMMLTLDYQAAA